MNAVSIRGDWVGQVIDGRFPLLEWLGGSGTSAVFLTELDGTGSQRAAIKLIPASAAAEDRLARWSPAATLSHPHLLRIFHFGRAEIDGTQLIYVVTELAEEVLSQIIPERPLSPEEACEMLPPILDALEYLHSNSYVHGHLEPSNILVIENEIKLSSDGLLEADKAAPELLANDIHIAPETATAPVSPSADVWSLGVTLVEALTQQTPVWDAASDTEPIVPASIPRPLSDIARECLHPNPARRCTLSEIRAMLPGTPKPIAPAPSHERYEQHRIADKPLPAKVPWVPLVIGFVLLVAIIVALQMRTHKTQTAPLQTETTQQSPAAEPDSKAQAGPSEQSSPQSPASSTASARAGSATGEVVSRAVPDVPRGASDTIHGKISVVVRVNVEAAGAVTNADLVTRGPSAYFARLALESARNWKFKAPQQDGRAVPSTWLLHYQFRRDGVDVNPNMTDPR